MVFFVFHFCVSGFFPLSRDFAVTAILCHDMLNATALKPEAIVGINDRYDLTDLRCQEWSGHAGGQEDNLSVPKQYGSIS